MNKIAFIILFNSFSFLAIGQNLVENSSFENILSQYGYSFDQTMSDWKNVSWFPEIYTPERHEILKRNGFSRLRNKVIPYEGNVMVELMYYSMGECRNFSERGASDYIGTRLKEPLKVGKKYEVSYWIYIPNPELIEFTNFIGFTLFRKPINNYDGLIYQNTFYLDTIIYNEWFKASWTIQPTCNLNFLVIGVFQNSERPPVSRKYKYNSIYVDNVEVVPANENKNAQKVTLFCKEEEYTNPYMSIKLPVLDCFFESNEYELSQLDKKKLDDYAKIIRENPNTVFKVSGYTDSIGTNNLELSESRINAVINYLKEVYKIPKIRFVSLPFGEKFPRASNMTEVGRKKNRRVEIVQTEYSISKAIYRNVLEEIDKGDISNAIRSLNIWLHFAPQEDKIIMLYDPRIEVLKIGEPWKNITNKVKESYDIYGENKELVFNFEMLWAEDQKCRTLHKYIENLSVWIRDFDQDNQIFDIENNSLLFPNRKSDELDEFPCRSDDFIQSSDENNYKELISLIGNKVWLEESAIGKRAAKGQFLVIQHCGDIEIMKKYLPLLEAKCFEGEAEWNYYAHLFDRIQVQQDLPQKYGTQFKTVNNKRELYPLISRDSINIWRREIGLSKL